VEEVGSLFDWIHACEALKMIYQAAVYRLL
jgi:hypothetical protein